MADDNPRADKTPQTDDQAHHIADEPLDKVETNEPAVRSPVTNTGLPVEDQVEKEWNPNKDGGLPTFFATPRR